MYMHVLFDHIWVIFVANFELLDIDLPPCTAAASAVEDDDDDPVLANAATFSPPPPPPLGVFLVRVAAMDTFRKG